MEVSGGNKGTWELTKVLKLGCEIVVGSPGRLIDMVKKKGTNLRRVTFLVLDEGETCSVFWSLVGFVMAYSYFHTP